MMRVSPCVVKTLISHGPCCLLVMAGVCSYKVVLLLLVMCFCPGCMLGFNC